LGPNSCSAWQKRRGDPQAQTRTTRSGRDRSKDKTSIQAIFVIKKDTGRRDHWIKQLIEAQSIDQKVTKKSLWKKIRTTERIWNNARMIKVA